MLKIDRLQIGMFPFYIEALSLELFKGLYLNSIPNIEYSVYYEKKYQETLIAVYVSRNTDTN